MATAPLSKLDASKLLTIRDKRDLLFFAIGLYAGRRVQEITNCKWKFLLDERGPKIWVPKQKKYHYFPRSEKLVEIINHCYEGEDADSYFMVARRGAFKDDPKPMSTTGVNKIIVKYLAQFGIRTIKEASHCLRKTFAVQFMEANRDREKEIYLLGWLQTYFGHKDIRTTMRYFGMEQKKLASLCNNISYNEDTKAYKKEKALQY